MEHLYAQILHVSFAREALKLAQSEVAVGECLTAVSGVGAESPAHDGCRGSGA